MKIAYIDCSSGISGDMFLAALVDAGASLREIEAGLRSLPLRGYRLRERRVARAGISSVKVDVLLTKGATSVARQWKDIRHLIGKSSLPPHLRHKGQRIFRRLFEAEGKVHGRPYHRTHLHELGATDCIVDIFGALIGIEVLGIKRITASPVNLGSGSVMSEHGRLPVPAPATAELLKGIPAYSSGAPFELTTPTGAAILAEVAEGFGALPSMRIADIGYGAGQKDRAEWPNVARIFLGESGGLRGGRKEQTVTVVETNIDDMNPQVYGYVMERLFEEGALDVYLTPVIMKKGRPGTVVTVLCPEEKKSAVIEILFRETTTIGVRFSEAARLVLKRSVKKVRTEFGVIRVKVSETEEGFAKFVPEYEDCRKAAEQNGLPLSDVIARVAKALERSGTGKA